MAGRNEQRHIDLVKRRLLEGYQFLNSSREVLTEFCSERFGKCLGDRRPGWGSEGEAFAGGVIAGTGFEQSLGYIGCFEDEFVVLDVGECMRGVVGCYNSAPAVWDGCCQGELIVFDEISSV